MVCGVLLEPSISTPCPCKTMPSNGCWQHSLLWHDHLGIGFPLRWNCEHILGCLPSSEWCLVVVRPAASSGSYQPLQPGIISSTTNQYQRVSTLINKRKPLWIHHYYPVVSGPTRTTMDGLELTGGNHHWPTVTHTQTYHQLGQSH